MQVKRWIVVLAMVVTVVVGMAIAQAPQGAPGAGGQRGAGAPPAGGGVLT